MDRETTRKLREDISTGIQNAPEENKAFLKTLLKILERHLEGKK